jgi:hypothetical protein
MYSYRPSFREHAEHDTRHKEKPKFMKAIMKLLMVSAIDAPGKGWRVNGFGLIIMAAVFTLIATGLMVAVWTVSRRF